MGVTSANGQDGLGTPYKTFTDAGWDCIAIALTNSKYNSNQLRYAINGAPNSNSYAYTLLKSAGLLNDVGSLGDVGFPPPNTPGWGYDVINNPRNLP